MNLFIAFSTLLAVTSASQLYYLTPNSNILPAVSNQYHSQDVVGQYAYGYNDHLSAKNEVKSLDGITRGSYSYIDSNNILQTANYVADAGGFRVAATNLPKPVEVPVIPAQDLPQQVAETPEVAAARIAHLAAFEGAKLQLGAGETVSYAGELPQQVQETPEVAAARAVHLAAIEEAKKQIGYQVVAVPSAPIVELPRPIEDTPEVAKAKAEHLIAIEQAKLRNSYQVIRQDSGLPSLVQSAPTQLIIPQVQLLSGSGSVPLPSSGFSYSSSVVNAPVASHYAYPPLVWLLTY